MKHIELTYEQNLQVSIWTVVMIEKYNVSGKIVVDAFRTAYSELQDLDKAKEQVEKEVKRYNETNGCTYNA